MSVHTLELAGPATAAVARLRRQAASAGATVTGDDHAGTVAGTVPGTRLAFAASYAADGHALTLTVTKKPLGIPDAAVARALRAALGV